MYEALILEPGAMDMSTADKLRLKNFLCQAFIFSALWGLGGNILETGRDGLDICIREIFDDHPDARYECKAHSLFGCIVLTSLNDSKFHLFFFFRY